MIIHISGQPELLLGAYRPPFTNLMNSREDAFEAYRRFAAAGLNLMVGEDAEPGEKTEWVIEACEKYNVKMLICLPASFYGEITEKDRKIADRLLRSSAFFGFIMRDEPPAGFFNDLARARIASEALMPPEKFSMANLFPNWANLSQMEIESEFEAIPQSPEDPFEHYVSAGAYTEYVRRYLNTVKPKLLCVDHYPISDKGRTDDYHEGINGYAFFKNLAVARIETARIGIPFWTIVQAWGYNRNKPAPNLYEFRWQVNANYVFGGKCTIYFVYQNSYPEGTGSEFWVDAPVDFYGNPTPQYEILQQVNSEFRAFGKAFMQFDHVGIMLHNPKPYQPFGVTKELLVDEYPPVKSIEGDGNLVIGCMSKDPLKAVYVMNGSYKEEAAAVLRLDMSRQCEIWGKDGREMNIIADSLPIRLEKGEAKFIVFE